MTERRTILRVTDLRKNYGHVQALDGASFDLREHEVHAVVGDNGAGKSTLIKCLSGDVIPDSGEIVLNGEPVRFTGPRDAREAGIETVYQDLALSGTLDAGENIYLGREIQRSGLLGRLGFIDRQRMRSRTREHLHELGITLPSVTVPVSMLSGGQRQAVAVARASAWGRQILIMDEPVAALAPQQTEFVLALMRRARDDHGLSIIFISHNLPHVFMVADRITVMRQGRDVLTCRTEDATNERLLAAMTGLSEMEGRPAEVPGG